MYRTSSNPDAVRSLAPQHLVGDRFSLGISIDPARYRTAVALLGSGVDHNVGETAVALLAGDLRSGANVNLALFTDRRVIARSDRTTLDVRYADITQSFAVKGIIFDDLNVAVGGRSFKLEGLESTPRVAGFLQALAQVHPGYRSGDTHPLPVGTPSDPLGLHAAQGERASATARNAVLFDAIDGAHRRMQMPAAVASDFVTRASLLERTHAWGRGAREGWWTSCLNPVDLAYAFARMFGPAVQMQPTHNGWTAVFALQRRSNVAGAAVSTAVGLLALGVLGVGWVSTPERSLGELRVQCAVGNGTTGFALLDGHESLSLRWAPLLEKIFENLLSFEQRMLLLRALWGWEADPAGLDAASQGALSERLRMVLGEAGWRPQMSL